tara:strand:- start:5845 stop:6219 length:375 start_codon:yes stop_codon:yes gene_type:complete
MSGSFHTAQLNATTINASANVIAEGGIKVPYVTTSQRNSLSGIAQGTFVYNTQEQYAQVYTGSTWKNVGGIPVLPTVANADSRPSTPAIGYTHFNIADQQMEIYYGEDNSTSPATALWATVAAG